MMEQHETRSAKGCPTCRQSALLRKGTPDARNAQVGRYDIAKICARTARTRDRKSAEESGKFGEVLTGTVAIKNGANSMKIQGQKISNRHGS